jgi:hypothetical protein
VFRERRSARYGSPALMWCATWRLQRAHTLLAIIVEMVACAICHQGRGREPRMRMAPASVLVSRRSSIAQPHRRLRPGGTPSGFPLLASTSATSARASACRSRATRRARDARSPDRLPTCSMPVSPLPVLSGNLNCPGSSLLANGANQLDPGLWATATQGWDEARWRVKG